MPAQELARGRNREGLKAGTVGKAGAEMGPRVKAGGKPVPTRLQERRNELATGSPVAARGRPQPQSPEVGLTQTPPSRLSPR